MNLLQTVQNDCIKHDLRFCWLLHRTKMRNQVVQRPPGVPYITVNFAVHFSFKVEQNDPKNSQIIFFYVVVKGKASVFNWQHFRQKTYLRFSTCCITQKCLSTKVETSSFEIVLFLTKLSQPQYPQFFEDEQLSVRLFLKSTVAYYQTAGF